MQLVFLVIPSAIAIFGYRDAAKFERQYRKGPWGASAAFWGIICFFTGLIGVVFLYPSTELTGASRATRAPLAQVRGVTT